MKAEELMKLRRQTAADLLRPMVHSGADVARVESGLNIEWWRGYHAAKAEAEQSTSEGKK